MTNQTTSNDVVSNPGSISFLALLIHFPSNMARSIKAWREVRETRLRDRKAIEQLQALNAHDLRDIGISKDDLNWASTLPVEKIKTRQLDKIARRKRYQVNH